MANDWGKTLAAAMTGAAQGYQRGQVGMQDIQKALMLERIKNAIEQESMLKNISMYNQYANKGTQGSLTPVFKGGKFGFESPSQPRVMNPLQEEKTRLEIKGLEQKQVDTQEKNQRESDLIRNSAIENLNTIKAIREGKKYFGPYANLPTLVTSAGGVIDYNARKKWENNINKLLSQKVVDLITTMKSASKTGATGFGQLSEREGQLLREASTALSKDLDPDTAMNYLLEMEKIYNKIVPDYSGNGTGLPLNPDMGTTKSGIKYRIER